MWSKSLPETERGGKLVNKYMIANTKNSQLDKINPTARSRVKNPSHDWPLNLHNKSVLFWCAVASATTQNNDHLLSKSFFPARSINQTTASKTNNNNNHWWRPPPPFYAHGLLSFVTRVRRFYFSRARHPRAGVIANALDERLSGLLVAGAAHKSFLFPLSLCLWTSHSHSTANDRVCTRPEERINGRLILICSGALSPLFALVQPSAIYNWPPILRPIGLLTEMTLFTANEDAAFSYLVHEECLNSSTSINYVICSLSINCIPLHVLCCE
jgi:hypothetical protein